MVYGISVILKYQIPLLLFCTWLQAKMKCNKFRREKKIRSEQFQKETPMFREGIIPLIISLVLEIHRSPSLNCFLPKQIM